MKCSAGYDSSYTDVPIQSSSQKICHVVGRKIEVCRPMLPKARSILRYVSRIDHTRRYTNHGALVQSLQERLKAEIAAVSYVAVASSGTSALTGAILASAGRPNDRRKLCLTPAYTFIGTVAAIEQSGFTPHFIDVDPITWMIEPDKCLDHRLLKDVGLVVPVAPYGRPVPQAGWVSFIRQTGIPVVIDAAAAFDRLAASPDRYLGIIPVAVSFHATKSFCTGEGGAVFCGDAGAWRATIQCLNFGCDFDRVCRLPCLNGKMSEYHAAVGLAELDSWRSKLARYKRVADRYMAGAVEVRGRLHAAPSVAANYALLEAQSGPHARAIMAMLEEAGIGCRRWYGAGVQRQPYCAHFGRDDLPVADDLAERLIGLPMSVDLKDDEVDFVLDVIKGAARVSDPARCPDIAPCEDRAAPVASDVRAEPGVRSVAG